MSRSLIGLTPDNKHIFTLDGTVHFENLISAHGREGGREGKGSNFLGGLLCRMGRLVWLTKRPHGKKVDLNLIVFYVNSNFIVFL